MREPQVISKKRPNDAQVFHYFLQGTKVGILFGPMQEIFKKFIKIHLFYPNQEGRHQKMNTAFHNAMFI
jgi:hypothetical protein